MTCMLRQRAGVAAAQPAGSGHERRRQDWIPVVCRIPANLTLIYQSREGWVVATRYGPAHDQRRRGGRDIGRTETCRRPFLDEKTGFAVVRMALFCVQKPAELSGSCRMGTRHGVRLNSTPKGGVTSRLRRIVRRRGTTGKVKRTSGQSVRVSFYDAKLGLRSGEWVDAAAATAPELGGRRSPIEANLFAVRHTA